MRVTKLTLHNFKSFQDVTIPFRSFNVVIGANASGKSNLVQAFQFLKDIADHGLENAVSLQGGAEFLRNMAAEADEPVRISVEFEYPKSQSHPIGHFNIGHAFEFNRSKYTLELKFNPSDHGIETLQEESSQTVQVLDTSVKDERKLIGEGCVALLFKDGDISIGSGSPSKITASLLKQSTSNTFLAGFNLLSSGILLAEPTLRIWPSAPTGVRVYDIEPHLPKLGTPRAGKADLEGDGSNLAIVVKDVLRDKEKSRKFHNLVGYLLPHVKKVSVEEFAFNSLMMNFRESYAPDRDMPATFISDGTIDMTAVLVAFAFEGNDMTILEEPDRNVHPRLISGLTSLMKDVARRSQILITTHNPEFVRLAGVENLLLVSRDKRGFSKVTRPVESDIVKTFLSDEIGIDDLFVDGFLTMGP